MDILLKFDHKILNVDIMREKDSYSAEARQLKAIINSVPDGIIIINHRGIIENINPAAAHLFGYSTAEAIGSNVSMLMDQPDRNRHDGYIKNFLKTREKKIIGIGREVFGRKKNGCLFPLRLNISEVQLGNRTIFAGILHDLSREKEQENKIKKLNLELEKSVEKRTEELELAVNRLLSVNKQLQLEIKERKKVEKSLMEREESARSALEKERELSELKSRFVTMASHEFRTPLSSILTSAELIEAYTSQEAQDKRMKNVRRIKNSVSLLTNVLNEFLSLSKLEENQLKPNPVSFHFDQFANQLTESLTGILKEGQKIEYEGLGKNKIVFLDKAFLNHSLGNLLSNAIKYSAKGKSIKFSATLKENQLHLKIVDEGIGIPPQDQQHLFTRFFRGHNVENIPGTGLGLNIVKKYLDLMGGKITFHSQMGEGTTFLISIPLNQELIPQHH